MKKNLRLPDTLQDHNYSCGPVCAQCIMAYYGMDWREDILIKTLHTSIYGAKTNQIIEFFKTRGFKVKYGEFTITELKKFIDRKIPVICLLQAWKERKVNYMRSNAWGHYVVACGYDDKRIYFEDPAVFSLTYLFFAELEKRWHGIDKVKLEHFGIAVYGKRRFDFKKPIHMK